LTANKQYILISFT